MSDKRSPSEIKHSNAVKKLYLLNRERKTLIIIIETDMDDWDDILCGMEQSVAECWGLA